MKKLSILILLLFSLILTGCDQKKQADDLLAQIKTKEKIVIGVKGDSKPFGFIQDDTPQGFDIDVAKQISKDIFLSDDIKYIEFVPVKTYERIPALNSGKVDILVATLSINDKRKEIIDFSEPYFVAGQTLMVPKSSRITSIEQLNNKNVAVILGSTGEKTVRMLAPLANAVGAVNYKEAVSMLQDRSVEAILGDDSLLYGRLPKNGQYKILNARYTKEYYAVGLRKGSEYESLKKQINKTIKNIQENGELNRINAKWIPKNKIQ